MFNNQLPVFFDNPSISNYFADNITDLFDCKTHETFEGETLNLFISVASDLENSLLEYNNLINQKIDYGKHMKKEFADNIEKMRDLNSQICVAKVEKKSFGRSILEDQYDGQIDRETLSLLQEVK